MIRPKLAVEAADLAVRLRARRRGSPTKADDITGAVCLCLEDAARDLADWYEASRDLVDRLDDDKLMPPMPVAVRDAIAVLRRLVHGTPIETDAAPDGAGGDVR